VLSATKKSLALLLAVATVLAAAPTAEEKQVAVFAPTAIYNLPILDRNGHEYIGLLELLEPLGRVTSQTSGPHWKIRYNTVEGEFLAGKTRSKIRGHNFDLAAPFLIESAHGLIPLESLAGLLPRFLGNELSFHENGRRLLIGEVGIQPSFQLEPGPPARLLLNFSGLVNPTIATEPGRLRMFFKRDPVVSPGSQSISFNSKVITQANYSENNGVAELDVSASVPLMATFGNGGKQIIVAAAPTAAAKSPAGQAGSSVPSPGQPENAPAARRPLVIVDPAHGGSERGAALSDAVAEKDVTLALARLLRHELETRGFAVLMLRESDTTVTLDQRASQANAAQGAIYISLHAVSQGMGAHVYTALLPAEEPSKGIFRAWNSAQSPVLPVSAMVANAVVAEMQKRQFAARQSPASLRPLNNVTMPAVAIELAPGTGGLGELMSATYQQQAADAIAQGIVSIRDRLEVRP